MEWVLEGTYLGRLGNRCEPMHHDIRCDFVTNSTLTRVRCHSFLIRIDVGYNEVTTATDLISRCSSLYRISVEVHKDYDKILIYKVEN
jgi:hypothetical protein